MSEEFEIPPELAMLESRLGSVPITQSAIDRDQLLYEAGWAAAMQAQASTSISPAVRSHRAWQTATGVFASLTAVFAIMLLQPNWVGEQRLIGEQEVVGEQGLVAEQRGADRAAVVESDSTLIASTAENEDAEAAPDNRLSANRPLTAGSRIDPVSWATEPISLITNEYPEDSHQESIKTAVELMNELLPAKVSGSFFFPNEKRDLIPSLGPFE